MKYLAAVFGTFIFSFTAWITLTYIQIGHVTKSSQWISEAYEFKEASANKLKGPKIVISSGSNTHFGINSVVLENFWNKPVINYGVHAGLGVQYILYRTSQVLKQGDIVILPLEYNLYQENGNPSEVYSDFILSRDTGYFDSRSTFEQFKIMTSLKPKRLYNGLKSSSKNILEPTIGIYGIQNINSHGDQINIEPHKMTALENNTLDNIHAEAIQTSDLSDFFIETMDAFIYWANIHNICVIAMPPNHMFFKELETDTYKLLYKNIESYYASRDISYAGNNLDYLFDKKYYFNTKYHLNSKGVEKRTKQIMKDIKEVPQRLCGSI